MPRWTPDIGFAAGLVIILVGSVAGVLLLVGGGRYGLGLLTYLVALVVGAWITVAALHAEIESGAPAA